MLVSYSAIPEGAESRLKRARYYGIVDGEIRVDGLGGLPDTIIARRWEGDRRLLVVDYKYTRDIHYLVAARFKAYSYLHEFNADCAAVIAPYPVKMEQVRDEEAYEQRGFYLGAAPYGGAIIEVNENGKLLAMIYADPSPDSVKRAKQAIIRVLKTALF